MRFQFNGLECAIDIRVSNCKSLRKPCKILRCLRLLSNMAGFVSRQSPGLAMVSSTRRFCARPSGVSLEATGLASP